VLAVHEHNVMQIQQRHEWKEETDEGMRFYRGIYHSKYWKFTTALKGTRSNPPVWENIETPTDEHWEALRDILFKKYQRKRCPWKLIEDIDKVLGKEPDPRSRK
jgi:hypothetical protein